MKEALMAVAAMVAGSTVAWAGPGTAGRTVALCIIDSPNPTAYQAKTVASGLFKQIGVALEWHGNVGFCREHPEQTIVISYSFNAPKDLQPGAMAIAYPFEGTRIEIFYDRIRAAEGSVTANFLGHVLAHEITHILQNVSRHSEKGLMKANWTPAERAQLRANVAMGFADRDAELIYAGLAKRHGVAGVTLAPREGTK